jgi:hypothetical protein
MNDFSELENQLKKLRPLPPSENLAARIERALAEAENCRASVSDASARRHWWWRFIETPYNVPLGLGLAAATALLIFAHLNVDHSKKESSGVASNSPISVAPQTTTNAPAQFIPADFTRVVYGTSDEGLHFRSGSAQPVRRLRSQTRETFQWRNPRTGASLRVSYPIEEVSLVPVSGQ